MVLRYIQLVKKLTDSAKPKLDLRTQVMLADAMEQKGEISVEIVEHVADKIGRGKTITDLMREVGILPPLESSELKTPASLKERVASTSKQTVSAVKKFQDIANEVFKSDDTELKMEYRQGLQELLDDLSKNAETFQVVMAEKLQELAKVETVVKGLEAEMIRLEGELKALNALKAERDHQLVGPAQPHPSASK